MSADLTAWADIHTKEVGRVLAVPGSSPFLAVKFPGARISATIVGTGATKARVEAPGDATLYLDPPTARELATAILATLDAMTPAAEEAA